MRDAVPHLDTGPDFGEPAVLLRTFAIGACPGCGTAYCGDHSWSRGGRRLCVDCARRFDAAAAEAESQRQADLREQRVVALAKEKASIPELAAAAFTTRSELVRTFTVGYHRGIGRLIAPKIKFMYAGTCYNRDSDDRAVNSYCVDPTGDIYEAHFTYSVYAGQVHSLTDGQFGMIADTLRKLMSGRPMGDNSDWHMWRNRK